MTLVGTDLLVYAMFVKGMRRWDAELTERIVAAADGDVSTVAETIFRSVLGEAGWAGLPEPVKGIFVENGPAIAAEARGGFLDVSPEQLGAIAAPALLVGGEDSPPALADVVRAMAETMPSARVEWVAGGHLIDPAHPAVLRFVDEVLRTP